MSKKDREAVVKAVASHIIKAIDENDWKGIKDKINPCRTCPARDGPHLIGDDIGTFFHNFKRFDSCAHAFVHIIGGQAHLIAALPAHSFHQDPFDGRDGIFIGNRSHHGDQFLQQYFF